MSHIADKGYKSKRFAVLVFIIFLVTIEFKLGGSGITAEQWLDFLKWSFVAWATSEVGKAGAEAVRDKAISQQGATNE